jgi:hypothetical protein
MSMSKLESAVADEVVLQSTRDPSPSGVVLRGDTLTAELGAFSDAHLFADLDGEIAGVFVPTYRPIPLGASVRVTIEIDDDEFDVRGVVRWIRDASDESSPGVGVAFDALDERAKDALLCFADAVPAWYYE